MNNQFSENLKRIRKENHLSQEQLAEELGVSRQAISKWESSIAYPEMDKILALCDRFHLNIDDLLHKDIKEVKGEEETKKKLNRYVDDFLKFITDSINLFSNMSFKSKLKCIFEEAFILFVLMIACIIIYAFCNFVISSFFAFLPPRLFQFIFSILRCIVIVGLIGLSIVVFIHIFKTRYLDYFDDFIQSTKKVDNEEMQETGNSSKIPFEQRKGKIIIRDPKHTEYRFVQGLFKIIIFSSKLFVLGFSFFLCIGLVTLFCFFILSFLLYKTGFFFMGLLGALLSCGVIVIILLLLSFNFVFNRKNDKKMMIWSFLLSLVILGISCGFVFVGSLNFDFVDNSEQYEVRREEIKMSNDLFFNIYQQEISYVEEDIDDVRLEYKINPYCQLTSHKSSDGVSVWSYCPHPMKMMKNFLLNLNQYKIINYQDDFYDIVVYASSENISILQNNKEQHDNYLKQYENRLEEYDHEIEHYQEQIKEIQSLLDEKESRIKELEREN